MGYLILAKRQYKEKVNDEVHSWNFGPNRGNFKKVIDIVKYLKSLQNFNYTLLKTKKFKETNILKLNSMKAKKKLNWVSKWNLTETLKQTLAWNRFLKNGDHARKICEKQLLNYIDKK